MKDMQRVAIYCRVSTSEQSTENQKSELVAYAAARGWQVWRIYEEKLSGASDKRPLLMQLMADAKLRRFDIVLCSKLDRMYRSTRGMLITLDEFRDLGIEFVALRDAVDLTTAHGRLIAEILSSISAFERSLIVERVKSGIAHAKARGVRFGRPITRREIEIRKLRADGLSYRQIAQQLGVSIGSIQRSLQGVSKG